MWCDVVPCGAVVRAEGNGSGNCNGNATTARNLDMHLCGCCGSCSWSWLPLLAAKDYDYGGRECLWCGVSDGNS